MNVIDTNIWIYFLDRSDSRKQAIAQQLVASTTHLVLPWQVGCEFISASKKLIPFGLSENNAWTILEDMKQSADLVALPEPSDWTEARSLQMTETLSFWDAVLVALCLRHGVRTLYTEDMGSPRTIRWLQLLNPFA